MSEENEVSMDAIMDDTEQQAATPEADAPVEDSAPLQDGDQQAQPTEGDGQTEEKPEGNAVQKRINQLTREKYEEKRKREELEARLSELEQDKQRPQVPTEAPTLESCDYDTELYTKEVAKYYAAKTAADLEAQRAQRSQEDARNAQNAKFADRVQAAKIDGYDQVATDLVNTVLIPTDILDAIQSDDKGPELVYYLGTHLDVAAEITSLPPAQAALRLGKISNSLSQAGANRKQTSAPPPIKPVGSGAAMSAKEPSEMSMSEIMAL